ncbi:MAG: M64 family metallopeptidase [Parvularcula sp.]
MTDFVQDRWTNWGGVDRAGIARLDPLEPAFDPSDFVGTFAGQGSPGVGDGGGDPAALFDVRTVATTAVSPPPAAPEYINLVSSGPSENRVDIWYVGDGYLSTQRQELLDDVMAQFNDMVSGIALNEPFGRYQNFFNVHVIFQPSAEEGADLPQAAVPVFVDTAFDSTYWYDGVTERLLYFSTSKADAAIASVIPAGVDVDMRFGTVNSAKYGGGGGTYAVYAGKDPNAFDIALHEMGHSYAKLADEYFTAGQAYSGGEPSAANATIDSTGAKWAHWLGYNDPNLGVVGAYEGAVYAETGAYRPTNNSKMRSLGNPFDPIAKEQFILDYYADVDPLDDWYQPGNTGKLINPDTLWGDVIDPAVISSQWYVNGLLDPAITSEAVDVATFGLAEGNYQIKLVAIDETDMVRINLDTLKQEVVWNIEIADTVFTASALDDLINGTALANTIDGLDGADQIDGLGGNDSIAGGLGADVVTGGEGNDVLFGDATQDVAALLASLGI